MKTFWNFSYLFLSTTQKARFSGEIAQKSADPKNTGKTTLWKGFCVDQSAFQTIIELEDNSLLFGDQRMANLDKLKKDTEALELKLAQAKQAYKDALAAEAAPAIAEATSILTDLLVQGVATDEVKTAVKQLYKRCFGETKKSKTSNKDGNSSSAQRPSKFEAEEVIAILKTQQKQRFSKKQLASEYFGDTGQTFAVEAWNEFKKREDVLCDGERRSFTIQYKG